MDSDQIERLKEQSFRLHVLDHQRLWRNLAIGVFISIGLIVFLWNNLDAVINTENDGAFFGSVVILLCPVILLLIIRISGQTVHVKVTADGVDSISEGFINYHDIVDIIQPLNRYGNNQNCYFKLSNKKKISFAPTNRFGRLSNEEFENFKLELEKRFKRFKSKNSLSS